MIKVKWLRPHPAFGYFAGEIGYVTAEWAAKLVEGGYIMLLPEDGFSIAPTLEKTPSAAGAASPPKGGENPPTHDTDLNPLPKDLPGREKLFEAGYRDLEKIKEAGELLMDAGISKSMCKSIAKYLKGK